MSTAIEIFTSELIDIHIFFGTERYFDKNTVVELEEIDITGAKESVTKKIDIPKPENGIIIPGAVTVHVKIEKE